MCWSGKTISIIKYRHRAYPYLRGYMITIVHNLMQTTDIVLRVPVCKVSWQKASWLCVQASVCEDPTCQDSNCYWRFGAGRCPSLFFGWNICACNIVIIHHAFIEVSSIDHATLLSLDRSSFAKNDRLFAGRVCLRLRDNDKSGLDRQGNDAPIQLLGRRRICAECEFKRGASYGRSRRTLLMEVRSWRAKGSPGMSSRSWCGLAVCHGRGAWLAGS